MTESGRTKSCSGLASFTVSSLILLTYLSVWAREDTPANKALRFHVNTSLCRPPDHTWRCDVLVVAHSGSTISEMIPTVLLETSGGVLSAVDTVVQRRNGARRLRDYDDDVDDDDDDDDDVVQ